MQLRDPKQKAPVATWSLLGNLAFREASSACSDYERRTEWRPDFAHSVNSDPIVRSSAAQHAPGARTRYATGGEARCT
jgi:hypothetical protein